MIKKVNFILNITLKMTEPVGNGHNKQLKLLKCVTCGKTSINKNS